jgi:hypothetical protein
MGMPRILPEGASSYTDDIGQAINVKDPHFDGCVFRLNIKLDITLKATGSDNKEVTAKRHVEGYVDFTVKDKKIVLGTKFYKAMHNAPYKEDEKTDLQGNTIK